MARKPTQTAATSAAPGINQALVAEDIQASDQLAIALAPTLDVARPYDRQFYVDKCRYHMARSAEEALEVGRCLLQLKEHEPHGEWVSALNQIGVDRTVAHRMMKASLKFSNVATSQHLIEAAKSKSKLFELVVLDDEELKELGEGGTVAGLTLDDIDTMSTSELRRTLREERAKAKVAEETKARQLADKNARQDALEEELDKLRHGGRDTEKQLALEREQAAVKAFSDASLALLGAIMVFDQAVADCLAERTEARITLTEQTLNWLFQRIAQIATERGMAVDFETVVEPEWVRALTPAKKAA